MTTVLILAGFLLVLAAEIRKARARCRRRRTIADRLKRAALLALGLLLLLPAPALACWPVVISGVRNVAPWTVQFATPLDWSDPEYIAVPNVTGWKFGTKVPGNYWLGVTSITMWSKHIHKDGTGRNDYLIVWGAPVVTSQQPHLTFPAPLLYAPGSVITGEWHNNSDEWQYMGAYVIGWLSTDLLFRDCR